MRKVAERYTVLLGGCAELARALLAEGLDAQPMRNWTHLMNPTRHRRVRAIVIRSDFLRGMNVADAVASLRGAWPLVDVLLWAPRASGSTVREALRAGARDVLLSQSTETVAAQVSDVIEEQKLLPRVGPGRARTHTFEGMLARSTKMWDLFDVIQRVANTDATVLILGETGTGKELIARAIHRRSRRRGRFVAINCGAVPETLIDSELFGHVKGTFTGATYDKGGLFRHAEAGTLMLDEIGNIPLSAQFRLLRALQEGAVRPVGGHQEVAVDARVVAATSSRLEEAVTSGRFREDLFYRLDVIRIEVPPLRARPEDIVFLFAHFAKKVAKQYNISRPDVHDSFLDCLLDYEWPGNVRQLENLTERLCLTHPNQRVTGEHFRKLIPFPNSNPLRARPAPSRSVSKIDPELSLATNLEPVVSRLERDYLVMVLKRNQGRVAETAAQAGISRRTLLRKMRRHGIDKREFKSAVSPAGGEGGSE